MVVAVDLDRRAGGHEHGGRQPGDGLGGQGPGGHGPGEAAAGHAGAADGARAARGRRGRAGPGRGAAAAGSAGAGREAELGQGDLLEQEQRPDGEGRGQDAIVGPQVGAELATALAVLDVAADRRRGRADPLGYRPQLEPDLGARQLAGLGRLAEGDAGPDEERLDAGHRRLHRLGDLLVGEGVHLAQEERRALGLGQAADVRHQEAEVLAAGRLLDRRLAGVGEVDVHRVDADRRLAAQVVEAAVAGDAVEPGPDVDLARVGLDRVEGGGEHLLEDVLGVLARGEHVAAEGEQPDLVAGDDRLEGGVLAAAHERDQTLVGGEPEQGRRPAQAGTGRRLENGGLHLHQPLGIPSSTP